MAKKKFKDPKDVRKVYRYESGSPYWNWAFKKGRVDEFGNVVEPRAANPETVAAEVPPVEHGEEMVAIVEVLSEGGLDRLSTRQRRAFRLVLIQGLTYKAAGKRMNISAMTCYEHVQAAGKKLKKLCEDKI